MYIQDTTVIGHWYGVWCWHHERQEDWLRGHQCCYPCLKSLISVNVGRRAPCAPSRRQLRLHLMWPHHPRASATWPVPADYGARLALGGLGGMTTNGPYAAHDVQYMSRRYDRYCVSDWRGWLGRRKGNRRAREIHIAHTRSSMASVILRPSMCTGTRNTYAIQDSAW